MEYLKAVVRRKKATASVTTRQRPDSYFVSIVKIVKLLSVLQRSYLIVYRKISDKMRQFTIFYNNLFVHGVFYRCIWRESRCFLENGILILMARVK